MPGHDLEKLLGGFAADTLTPEEKQALYTDALQDQPLFNALADEQALKELLSDPDVRRRLLASLERQRDSSSGSALSWLDWFRRPQGLALAGGLSAAVLAVVLGIKVYQDSLNQAVQSVAIEETKPASPPVATTPGSQAPTTKIAEPQAKAKEEAGPAKDMRKAAKQMEAPAVSARALFYAADQAKPLAEPAPQANRLEGTLAPLKPLGLRYSFVVRKADGQERTEPLLLTLESNQNAYLQIWKRVGSSTPQLQLPEKETGQISLKVRAGQRQYMQLPVGREPAIFTARISLLPFGPITRQEAATFERPSPHQIQESITERTQTGSQERATYVVNQDLSTNAQITVEIIPGR